MVVSNAQPITSGSATPPIIDLTDVIRVYHEVDVETIALRGIDLQVAPGEFVAIMGRSGSGKSTLLHLLAGSDRPTAGRIMVDGIDLARATEDERAGLRGSHVGLIFQSQNLVPFLNLRENLLLAAMLAGRPIDGRGAIEILARVGLAPRAEHRPAQLSGGEQQRAALAAVLATRSAIVLADEVTGELDSVSAAAVLDLIEDIHAQEGSTVILATHDPAVARRAARVLELRDGRIATDRAQA